jgi:hypothetical protein
MYSKRAILKFILKKITEEMREKDCDNCLRKRKLELDHIKHKENRDYLNKKKQDEKKIMREIKHLREENAVVRDLNVKLHGIILEERLERVNTGKIENRKMKGDK